MVAWCSNAPLAAAAIDPPFNMAEATPDSNHIRLRAQDIWGYAARGREYALVTYANGLLVVDVTDPADPVVATDVTAMGADLKDVKTRDHYAYAVHQNGPVQIIDLSDPYHAYTAGTFISPDIQGAHNLYIDGDFLYLAMQGTGGDMRILDISDRRRPLERGFYRHPRQGGLLSCHDVYVRNDTCFASYFQGGMVVLDVTDKDFPVPLVTITYPGAATHNAWTTVDGRYLLTTDEQTGGALRVFDLRPTRTSVIQVGGYAAEQNAIIHNVHVKGPHAYVSYYSAGVKILDLTNPRRPAEVGAYDTNPSSRPDFSGCWGIYPYSPSGLVYASDRSEGLFVLRHLGVAAGVVRGLVRVSGAELEPIADATVELLEAGIRTTTDATGFFQIRIDEGEHTVRIGGHGFRPQTRQVTVTDGGLSELRIFLEPTAGPIDFVGGLAAPRAREDGGLMIAARVRAREHAVARVSLHYRAGGLGFRTIDMVRTSEQSEEWIAFVPPQLPGTMIEYYAEASSVSGDSALRPNGAPELLARYVVGELDWTAVLAADFDDDDGGFTVGSSFDWGERGAWERAEPNLATVRGREVQPGSDADPDPGGACFITQNTSDGAAFDHQLDGRTTLTAPVFTAGDARSARLVFHLWYVNDAGGADWQDPFLVEGSNDGGQTFHVLESIRVAEPGWHAVTIDLGGRLRLTDSMQIRFVAEDAAEPSWVEAAVDGVVVETTTGLAIRELGAGEREVVLLRQNVPNPFNPATTITYQLKEAGDVRLRIYDGSGRLVRVLHDGPQGIGDHGAVWDGSDTRGAAVASGVYFYRLEAAGRSETRKMILAR